MSQFHSAKSITSSKFSKQQKSPTVARSNGFAKFLFVVLFILLPMLLIWLFLGEINLSTDNMLVPINGKRWGNVNGQDNDGFGYNNTGSIQTSWIIYVAMLAVLGGSLLVFILFTYITPWIKGDTFPFIMSTWFGFFILVVSGLIYIANLMWLVIIIRLMLISISFLVGFATFNWITNRWLVRSSNSYALFEAIRKDDAEVKKIKDEVKEIKAKYVDDIEYIEIEEEQE